MIRAEDGFAILVYANATRWLFSVADITLHWFYLWWRDVTVPFHVTAVAWIGCSTARELKLWAVFDVMLALFCIVVRGWFGRGACLYWLSGLAAERAMVATGHYGLNSQSLVFERERSVPLHILDALPQIRFVGRTGSRIFTAAGAHVFVLIGSLPQWLCTMRGTIAAGATSTILWHQSAMRWHIWIWDDGHLQSLTLSFRIISSIFVCVHRNNIWMENGLWRRSRP
jgi:hypothetical protein